MYELIEHDLGSSIKWTQTDGTISFIPLDPANSDYQAYLRWLENPDADEAQSL